MLNLDNAIISKCILHKVGNSHASEPSIFSNALLNLDEYKKTELKKVCTKVFKQPIPTNQFVHTINLQQNVVFKLAESIFSDSVDFKLNSIQLVKYLFDQSTHYSIKAGEVFIIKLENVSYNEMQSDAIGIFKIEHVTNFIQPKYEDKSYSIMFENGIIGKNIEKACIIFNYDYDYGFNVFSFEKNSADTQYWNKNFLNIKRKENDYNSTNVLINSLKEFVSNDLAEVGINKIERLALFNESINQLTEHQAPSLLIADFINDQLPDKDVQKKYFNFLEDYKEAHDVQLADSISVSKDAVQYQFQKNKSVIKLDKNFHIYVHGDESKIVCGIDDDGRKFYKLYYENEI